MAVRRAKQHGYDRLLWYIFVSGSGHKINFPIKKVKTKSIFMVLNQKTV